MCAYHCEFKPFNYLINLTRPDVKGQNFDKLSCVSVVVIAHRVKALTRCPEGWEFKPFHGSQGKNTCPPSSRL